MSDLGDVTTSTLILSGPRLSNSGNSTRQPNDGYIFDAIFVVTPQFYRARHDQCDANFYDLDGTRCPLLTK